MTCLKCRHSNDRSRRFCGACGHVVGQSCQSCGFANEASDHYCGGCGRAKESASALNAEGDIPAPAVERSAVVKPSATAAADARQPSMSAAELAELLEWEPPTPVLALLGKVSQDELDGLFAGEVMPSH